MKLKDIKIGSKITGGFAIVLFLTAIVGYTGFNGLENVAHQVSIAEEENLLVKDALEIRRHEKNYLLRGDEKYVKKVDNLLADIRNHIENSDDGSIKETEMLEIALDYSNAFHSYVDLKAQGNDADSQELKKIEAVMIKSFNEFTKIAEQLHQIAIEEIFAVQTSSQIIMLVSSLIALLLGIVVSYVISRSISKPLLTGVKFAQAIENRDLTQELNMDRQDEIGTLANALDSMSRNLRKMVLEMTDNASTLAGSATEFAAISEQLLSSSDNMSEKSNTVASATEEINTNMSTISAASEQSSVNISVVASSTEEMTTTVSEIAQNTSSAQQIAGDAVSAVKNALNKVNGLGASAQDIGNVVEVILEIAEQTKLLALNATIEAARAGEAGKGFAVVANEVKELAAQTNSAIEQIRQKIIAIQSSTDDTITEISNIDKVINNVNEIVTSIATAVEEQSVTTKDIASNITQAADGIKDMAQNVTQAASATNLIASDVAAVNQGSNDIKAASEQVSTGVKELSKMGEDLKTLFGGFQI